jgi:copper chaperone CopZ
MKSLKKIVIATILLLSIQNTFAQLTKVEIIATGLTCSMCSNAINKQLKTLTDVEKVDIDLNTNTFIVFLKKNNQITPKILKDKVENAGFFVGEMVLFVPFENQKIIENAIVNTNNMSFVFIDSKNTTLNGDTKLKVFDKGYLTSKALKKASKFLKLDANNSSEKENIYHVKII